MGFNPLFLYGGVGLGKTHLMHAIAWELIGDGARPASVAYMSAETLHVPLHRRDPQPVDDGIQGAAAQRSTC